HHHAVGDHGRHVLVEDAGGDQPELQEVLAGLDRVPRVAAALAPDDQVGPAGEEVDGLPLALVPPLRPDEDRDWHSAILPRAVPAAGAPSRVSDQKDERTVASPTARCGTGSGRACGTP